MLPFGHSTTVDYHDDMEHQINASVLEKLKQDFLPKSLSFHISRTNEQPPLSSQNIPAAGLGLRSMVLKPSANHKSAKGEVVINIGSATPTSVSSETDSEDEELWDSWRKLTGGVHSWRTNQRHRRKELEVRTADGSSDDSSYRSTESDGQNSSFRIAQASDAADASKSRKITVACDAAEVIQYAEYLGIDPVREPHLLCIAEEGLMAALPAGWTEHEDASGNVYYHEQATGCSVWQHPLDAYYRERIVAARRRHAQRHDRRRDHRTQSRSAAAAAAAAATAGGGGGGMFNAPAPAAAKAPAAAAAAAAAGGRVSAPAAAAGFRSRLEEAAAGTGGPAAAVR